MQIFNDFDQGFIQIKSQNDGKNHDGMSHTCIEIFMYNAFIYTYMYLQVFPECLLFARFIAEKVHETSCHALEVIETIKNTRI